MIRCENCGAELDEDELRAVEEPRGEFWGIPCSETIYVCPICGNDDLREIEEDEDED